MALRVFLVDDHEIVRSGLRSMLEADGDIEVVGEAGTAAEATTRGIALGPDVAVLDVRLPDSDGIEVCRELRSRLPKVQCLMLTSFANDEALFAAIMAGVPATCSSRSEATTCWTPCVESGAVSPSSTRR